MQSVSHRVLERISAVSPLGDLRASLFQSLVEKSQTLLFYFYKKLCLSGLEVLLKKRKMVGGVYFIYVSFIFFPLHLEIQPNIVLRNSM